MPVPDELSAPYWDAAARHVLTVARCRHCRGVSHPPDEVCPHCGHSGGAYDFEPVTGGGTVRSWTVVRRSLLPGFEVPFVLVDVELDEHPGVRLIGRLLDPPAAPISLHAPVDVRFEDLAAGVAVPAFALAGHR